jgi:hypothetical protein
VPVCSAGGIKKDFLGGGVDDKTVLSRVDSTGVGILLALLALIPCVGLIGLLIINGKATSVLKDYGIRVGLLGAKMSDFS